MKRFLLLSGIIIISILQVHAQCSITDVAVPEVACLKSNFLVHNNSTDQVLEWDLCPVDLQVVPSALKVMNTGLSSSIDLDVIEDDGVFYGFVGDAASNSLVRLDFGDSRENVPVKVNLGNINGLFKFPNSVSLVEEDGRWFGIVANGGDKNVMLLQFGEDLSGTPSVSILHTRVGGGFANIAIASDSEKNYALLIAEFNARQVTVVNYSQGFLAPATSQQTVPIPGSSPIDVQLLKQCNYWTALVLSFENRKLYRLDFTGSFSNAPEIAELPITLPFEPYRLSLVREGQSLYSFISTTSGGLARLSFGTSLDNSPTVEAMGSFGVLSNSRSLHISSKDGHWLAFMINFSSGDLYRLSFLANCGVSPTYAIARTPGYIQYNKAGEHDIAVRALPDNGTARGSSYHLTITNDTAPEFSIDQKNACVNHEVTFEATNVVGTIAEYNWTFEDGSTSYDAKPSHFFDLADDYTVSLLIKGENACLNQKEITATVFNEPSSEFLLPDVEPACTNQELKFVNSTQVDQGVGPYWRWYVNSAEVSNDQDLVYSFDGPGPHNIKLIAGIPGCESESQQSIDQLLEGPAVEFNYIGTCVGDTVRYFNLSSGDIHSYEWDFGDGNISAEKNPYKIFPSFGAREVTLYATGSNGCFNSKTQVMDIKSMPIIDFQIAAVPLACSGTPAEFDNLSFNPDGDDISNWHWTFGDQSTQQTSNDENARHVFSQPGTYSVSLDATTSAGCTGAIEKEITIHPSPSTTFSFSSVCEDVPVQFTGPDDPGIESSYWEFGTSYSYENSPTHTFAAPGDYRLYGEFYGFNGCISTIEKTIHVPIPLAPNFSVLKNCVGHNAVFTNTTQGTDPVINTQWAFRDTIVASGSPVTQTFTQPGTETVTMRLTTDSGCQYELVRNVQIVPAPVAAFSVSPETGAYPLEAVFTNTSSHANRFHWNFMDGSQNTSILESPAYTFSELGSFDVILTAYNDQQCEETFVKTISTVAPLPDVRVEKITLTENADGLTKLVVTIHNNGNTILKDLPLVFDFAGTLSLFETAPEVIMPGTRYNFVLSSSILNTQFPNYLCVSLDVQNDLSPEDNRSCSAIETELSVFPVYPNPVSGNLQLQWIARQAGTVSISLTDQLGRKLISHQAPGKTGLNTRYLDLKHVRSGIYLLLIENKSSKIAQRILVID